MLGRPSECGLQSQARLCNMKITGGTAIAAAVRSGLEARPPLRVRAKDGASGKAVRYPDQA
jgi:hypothetical protein